MPLDRQRARLTFAVLRTDEQLILAALVREIRDTGTVGRPDGRSLVDAARLRQVADVALLRRDRHDVAAEVEHGAGAGRRERRGPDPLRAADEALARLALIRGNGKSELTRLAGRRVEKVKVAGLLVDDVAAAGGRVQDRKVGVPSDLSDGRHFRVERIQVELAIPVRAEIQSVPDPHRIDVVRPRLRLRDLLHRLGLHVEDADRGHLPAAIVLPLQERRRQRVVGNPAAVGRIGGARRVRDRQRRLDAAGLVHCEELRVAAREDGAGRSEEDLLPVRREALDQIRPRMPSEPRQRPALDRDHEHVRVAVVVGAEGQRLSVGRERRIRHRPFARRQAPDRRCRRGARTRGRQHRETRRASR